MSRAGGLLNFPKLVRRCDLGNKVILIWKRISRYKRQLSAAGIWFQVMSCHPFWDVTQTCGEVWGNLRKENSNKAWRKEHSRIWSEDMRERRTERECMSKVLQSQVRTGGGMRLETMIEPWLCLIRYKQLIPQTAPGLVLILLGQEQQTEQVLPNL